MSVVVKCTIEVTDEMYEAGTKHQEIFTVFRHASSTGTFSGIPGAFVRSLVEGSARLATDEALNRLKAIKGSILFDDEEALGVLKQTKVRPNAKPKSKLAKSKSNNKEDV